MGSSGVGYYIVKFSRGTGVLNAGYALVARGTNTCGIANYAILPES
jgi:hypothetical protein